MGFSFWEQETWFTNVDYTVVGSGIVGLTCALRLRERFPKAKILVLERGMLPNGASTKNAGFACFGSISEILDDLKSHSEDEVVALVKKRIEGLSKLRTLLTDKSIDYQENGGYELFLKKDKSLYKQCVEAIPTINKLLFPIFKKEVYSLKSNDLQCDGIYDKVIFNNSEGQIDTGSMMQSLLQLAQSKGILILNNTNVISYAENASEVTVVTSSVQFKTKKLLIATNGFAKKLGLTQVKPARAQVLITNKIPDLHLKGTFHLDRGYYYFRNINGRILLGGGRNLDFKGEETTVIAQTEVIQQELERLLKEVILPHKKFEIAHRWSGIMGVGSQKQPLLKKLSDHTYCGVRLGGMGVAIGATVGEDLANLIA